MNTCPKCGRALRGARYPLQPLADLLRESVSEMTTRLHISGATLRGYQCHGIGERSADRLAARVGVPAYTVWPEMIDDVISDTGRECAAEDCTARFHGHPNQRYCSPQCRRRIQARRHRERHRDRYRARQRSWRERNAESYADYQRRYQRRWMALWRAKKKAEAA